MEVLTRESSEVVQKPQRETRKIRVIELPSKFKPYPIGVEIYYHPFSIGELEASAELFESDDVEKLRSAFDGIECVGMTPNMLDYQDLVYIMILRKLTSFNESQFTLNYDCPKQDCGLRVEKTMRLDEIDFNDLPEELVKLPIKFKLEQGENSGKELVINTVTAEKYIEYMKLDLPVVDSTYLAMTVQNMTIPEAIEVIKTVSGEDLQVLLELREILDFAEQHVKVECPHCKKSSTLNVEVLSQLAVPFRRDRRDIMSKIYASS